MYPIPGHLALGLFGAKLSAKPLLPILLATFIPDVADKILADVLHWAPYGRCWMHTLLSVALISGVLYKWLGKEWGIGWAVGHLLHLIGDIGFIPWFYPFISYTWPDAPNVTKASLDAVKQVVTLQEFTPSVKQVFIPKFLLIEAVMLGFALVLYRLKKNSRLFIVLSVLLAIVYVYRVSFLF